MTAGTIAATDKCVLCRLHHKRVRTSVNLPGLNEVFAGRKSAAILGGNSAKTDAGRFSYWVCEPKDVFEFHTGQSDPFGKLQRILDKYRLENPRVIDLPAGIFCGGWVGYFSYELGRYVEHLPETAIDDLEMPLIRLCFYDRVICYDHVEKVCRLIVLQLADDTESPQEKLSAMEKLLTESEKICVPQLLPGDLDDIDFSQIRCNIDRDYYLGTVEKIKRYIYDGEVYQVNFSQRFECDYKTPPIKLSHWQNLYNPSGYAAYIDGGDFYIVSASPEMFITIADGIIQTKPIKGTRPRVSKKQINEKNFSELLHSEKEKAELNMIIDLERNDLTRVCEYGTIRVVQPRTIESYPTVFHAVATVEGRLRSGISFCDVLKAMFPGGSITGAPKVAAMKIIEQTEPTARGVYTGGIGFIGIDGNACLNIAIRTIIITGGRAFAQTGGGIVADSDPDAEWNETITKARALLAGIKAVQK